MEITISGSLNSIRCCRPIYYPTAIWFSINTELWTWKNVGCSYNQKSLTGLPIFNLFCDMKCCLLVSYDRLWYCLFSLFRLLDCEGRRMMGRGGRSGRIRVGCSKCCPTAFSCSSLLLLPIRRLPSACQLVTGRYWRKAGCVGSSAMVSSYLNIQKITVASFKWLEVLNTVSREADGLQGQKPALRFFVPFISAVMNLEYTKICMKYSQFFRF